jgi:hypothetical protein
MTGIVPASDSGSETKDAPEKLPALATVLEVELSKFGVGFSSIEYGISNPSKPTIDYAYFCIHVSIRRTP